MTDFMVGFTHGVNYYNQHEVGADVEVLGWDNADPGWRLRRQLRVHRRWPPLGRGLLRRGLRHRSCRWPVLSAWAARPRRRERGLAVIGVDTDSFVSAPEFADVWLTSVVKKMDVAVFDTIKAAMDGTLTLGDDYLGTLANGGVGLADFHNWDRPRAAGAARRAGGRRPRTSSTARSTPAPARSAAWPCRRLTGSSPSAK
ncbi:MAG: hypothetical protein V9H69_13920 [Anaerolineae bacterium]